MDTEILKHESYGQINFHRTRNYNASFYGSDLEQDHFITMEVHHSETHRDLAKERFCETHPLLRVRMSAGQFAELITSINYGIGVPCTIESIHGKKVAELPTREKNVDFTHRHFDDRMKEFAKKLQNKKITARNILNKKTHSKQDVQELVGYIDTLTEEVTENIPYFEKCFREATNKTISEAITEAENKILHKITIAGLGVLQSNNKELGGGTV